MSKVLTLLAAALLALALAGPAAAGDHDRARDAVRSGQVMPLGQIVGQVGARYPGRLLDADLDRRGDNLVYRLRWLTREGNVLNIAVDGRTGRVLNVQGQR